VRLDEGDVDAAGDHRVQRGIGGRLAEAVEPTVLEVRDSRRELKAKQAAQREDMVGITTAIGVVPSRRDLTLMIEQRVEHVQRLARCRRDQLRVERRVAIGEVGIDLEAGRRL
jgi:Tat protein secretion system quality control protein TatD with DNase activity